MTTFSMITVIYNPNSTGSSKQQAEQFKAAVLERLPDQAVQLQATEYAGHAEEIAYEAALASERPLVVSASGDGGYHEVINGALRAQTEGADVVTGLLPAGNANDHYRSLHSQDIIDLIVGGEVRAIDILELQATSKGQPVTRYGHSYIGVGLSPQVGRELNKTQLNMFNQVWIFLRVFLFARAVPLVVDGKKRWYDSLILSNINKMSKVMTLSPELQVNDGKFEVHAFTRSRKLALIGSLIKASTVGAEPDASVASYQFTTTNKTTIQIDGELLQADPHTSVTVRSVQAGLRCIV